MNGTDQRLDAHLRSRFLGAATELGASEATRRRVVDPTPRSTLRPLAAALAVAVVAGSGGALLARHLHTASPAGAHQDARPTASPQPSAKPSPTPQPVSFARLYPADVLTLVAPRAYGHLSLTGTDNTLQIAHYTLAVQHDPGSPATAPVWQLAPAPRFDAATLGARFDLPGSPTTDSSGVLTWHAADGAASLTYDPDSGQVSYSGTTAGAGPANVGAAPTDKAGAGRLAARWMAERGLLPPGAGAPEVTYFPQSSPQPWSVDWPLHIGSYPLEGPYAQPGMGLDAQGGIQSVMILGLGVDHGSTYPVIPWRQAWAQVAAGHWYRECCDFTGGDGPSSLPGFTATSVELGYASFGDSRSRLSGTERKYLVPMWVFFAGDGTRLFYPAVAPSALTYTWAPQPWPSPR